MKKYARIEGGIVAELLETDGDITQMFHPALVWVEHSDDAQVGDTYQNGVFTHASPLPPTAESLWATYQGDAKAALTKSDITILRCYESGITVPAEWAAYRSALRAIISSESGDPSAQFPPQPPFPAGT